MNETLHRSNAVQEPTTRERRNSPGFATVVVGARHEGPGSLYRKGELYKELNTGMTMSRFLRVTEESKSTGMLVVTRDNGGDQHHFYIMRGAPKGVVAHPEQVSITDVEESVKNGEFATKVSNPDDVQAASLIVGQGLNVIPSAGPIESILMDTGEKVPIDAIDTNADGESMFTKDLRDTQQAMKIVEQQTPTLPFGR